MADITYLPSQIGPLYLSLVTDAYSRKIVSHHVHDSLHAESVARAYGQALWNRTARALPWCITPTEASSTARSCTNACTCSTGQPAR
ncbi:hypothetical protein PtoMrB4_38430 [Metapseudomonas otitidis]|uniref:Integrase catalytic domain-containing protein n=1 Tax=Metapseudomonas otitidis TaxID=319939 RepID=A0A679GFM7_9GAMM|nr:hypothetical protein PtoMrB4_38430 [Pseudomonas otitidis]